MTQQTSSLEYLAGRYSCELAFAHQHPQLCLEFIQKLLSDPAILAHIPAVKALREENAELHDKVEQLELDEGIWPEWAEKLLKMARKHNGNDSSDDADGVCLLAEMEQAFDMFKEGYAIADRQADALKERIAALESQLAELRQGGEAVAVIAPSDNGTGLIRAKFLPGARSIHKLKFGDLLYTRPQPAIPPGYAVASWRDKFYVTEARNYLAESLENVGADGIVPCGKDAVKNVIEMLNTVLAPAPAIQPQAAAPSVPVAEKALPENVKLLLLKAHRQLETEYRQQTRATEAKRVANGTCGESPGGASSIALLAESGYISSIGKRNQEVRDEIFAMLAAPADSKEGEK